MKRIVIIAGGLLGALAWLFGKKPKYSTKPERPAFMWRYPDTEEGAWLKYQRRNSNKAQMRRE